MIAIDNKITQFPDIENCTNLINLYLYKNKISYIPKTYLQKLNKLKTLLLRDNPILFEKADIPIDLFENNLLLERLGLETTGIKTVRNGTFSKLRNLREL